MTDPEARIDAALRQMAGGHASGDFVSRVRGRIAPGRPSSIAWRPVGAAAAALLIVVAAGLVSMWRAPAPARAPAAVPTRASGGSSEAARPAPRPPVEMRDRQPRSATTGTRRHAVASAPGVAPRDHERALPPLHSIETLEVTPLSVAPLTLADHAPVPLPAILPLDVSGGPDDVGGDR